MTEHSPQRLGTISIFLGAIPLLALVSWFVFYTPCGSLRREIIENIVIYGTIVAVPFGIYAAVKEKPRKRALIGLTLGLVPFICFVVLVAAIVYAVATGGRGIPGILDIGYSSPKGAPMSFETGVFATTETKYYDVKGSTLKELDAEVKSLGPRGFVAETVPYYHWNYTYKMENGSCRIDKVRVDTRIVFMYPRWDNPNAEQSVVEEWRERITQVEQHEAEHERIDRRTGEEIRDAITRLPQFPTCADLEKELDARAQALIAKGREEDEEFDRATDHGRKVADANP